MGDLELRNFIQAFALLFASCGVKSLEASVCLSVKWDYCLQLHLWPK